MSSNNIICFVLNASHGVMLFVLAPNLAPPNFVVKDWGANFVVLQWDAISLSRGNVDGYKVGNALSFFKFKSKDRRSKNRLETNVKR